MTVCGHGLETTLQGGAALFAGTGSVNQFTERLQDELTLEKVQVDQGKLTE